MRVEWNGKTYEFERPVLVSAIFERLSLSRESHLAVVNGKLVTEDFKPSRDDTVRLIRVISGG